MEVVNYFTTENKNENPVLIIDSRGDIGEKLASKIADKLTVIVLSNLKFAAMDNVIPLPFDKGLSQIPHNVFSQVIVIDERLELGDKNLGKLVKITQKNKTPLFIAAGRQFVTDSFFIKNISANVNIKLGILGDVFATDRIIDKNSDVGFILAEVKKYGKIDIPGNGTIELFPVFLEDAVDAIMEICFSGLPEKTYYISPKNKISFLSFALTLKKVYPEIKLDFVEEGKRRIFQPPTLKGKYILGDDYDLVKALKQINFQAMEHFNKPEIVKKNSSKTSIFLTSLFFLFLLCLPLVTTLTCLFVGETLINYSKEDLVRNDSLQAESKSIVSYRVLSLASISMDILRQEVSTFVQVSLIERLSDSVDTNYRLSKNLVYFSRFINKINVVLAGKSANPNIDLDDATMAFKNSYLMFNELTPTVYPQDISQKASTIYAFTSATENFWPEFFGFFGTKKYLILIEDNTQNASASGSVNNYFIIGFDKGKVTKYDFGFALPKNATDSAMLQEITTLQNFDGIIKVTDDKTTGSLINEISKFSAKGESKITLDSLYLLISSLENQQLKLTVDDPAEQAALSALLR